MDNKPLYFVPLYRKGRISTPGKKMKVEIITIGDEILIGQIIETNSAWMAAELTKAGFEVTTGDIFRNTDKE